MPLAFLLDEHLRGPLWQAILRHNLRGEYSLDVVRVGDPADLPLAADDPAFSHGLSAKAGTSLIFKTNDSLMPVTGATRVHPVT